MNRAAAMILALCACTGSPATKDDTGTPDTPTGACALAAESQSCPSCSEGDLTCTYGAVSVTAGSCGECQARSALYQALCDAGVTDSREAITEGVTCAPPDCVVWVDTCTDPCAPLCVPEHIVPADTTCDLGCPDTALPDPGDCVRVGPSCTFQ